MIDLGSTIDIPEDKSIHTLLKPNIEPRSTKVYSLSLKDRIKVNKTFDKLYI